MVVDTVNYDVEPESAEETIPAAVQALIDRKKAAEKKEEKPKESEAETSGR